MNNKEVDPTNKLYSSNQVGLATFLGGPLGGAWLLAINFRRLGRRNAARYAIFSGVFATFALLAVGVALPESFPRAFLPVLIAGAAIMIASSLQGEAYEAHVEHGGGTVSAWKAAGLGLAAMAGTFVLVVAFVSVMAHSEIRGIYHAVRGAIHYDADRFDESISSYRRSIELYPAADTYIGLGDALRSQGDPLRAIGAYEKALELEPENTRALNQIAWLYATAEDSEARDPQKALEFAQRAVELEGESALPSHLDTLAEAHYVNGHFDEAIEIEKRLVSMEPDEEFYKEQLTKFEQAKAAQANR